MVARKLAALGEDGRQYRKQRHGRQQEGFGVDKAEDREPSASLPDPDLGGELRSGSGGGVGEPGRGSWLG